MSSPSRFAEWCLRRLLPGADADALLGDLSEHAALDDDTVGTDRPSLSIRAEGRAWGYIAFAAIPLAVRRGGQSMGQVLFDAWRALRSAPATTAGIIAILTLGISAATVTFSVVDTVVLRPLPFDDDHELVVIELRNTAESALRGGALGPTHFLHLRAGLATIEHLAAARGSGALLDVASERVPLGGSEADPDPFRGLRTPSVGVASAGEQIPLRGIQATASLFEVLGVRPLLGQTFTEANEVEGNDRVALISYALWQRQFGGDPTVVGRPIPVTTTAGSGEGTVDGTLKVIGVMPQDFAYPISMTPPADIWTPWVVSEEERTGVVRSRYLHVVGRLRPDETIDHAEAEIGALAGNWRGDDAEFMRTHRFEVMPLKDTLVGQVRGWMLLVLAAVIVVMLIACVNVANLQLVRATRRVRELSIRASLGATRRQLVASLLAESLMLAIAAAALAVLVARWGVKLAKAGLPADLARAADISVDVRVLIATIVAAVVTGVLFGLVPAWQASREDLVSLAKQGSLTLSRTRRRWRAAFVVAEVAFVSILLVGATLIISSFVRVTTIDLGFDRTNLLLVSGDTGDDSDVAATVERLRHLSGVVALGVMAMGSPPLAVAGFHSGGSSATSVDLPGRPSDPSNPFIAEVRRVSPGYFAATRITVLSGRSFDTSADEEENGIVIDERVAGGLFGRRDVVGSEVVIHGGERRIVTGVVRHVSWSGPEDPALPQVYLPLDADRGQFDYLVVRVSAPLPEVVSAIRGVFPTAVTSGPRAMQIRAVDEAFRNITADRRFNAGLMSIFGAIAIVIGAAGIYGVMASVVVQQRREMGLRVALGATTARIVSGVMRQAARYLGVGLVLGLAAAWWASKALESILFGVQPGDPVIYAIVAAVMMGVGVAAALIPARRAARVDPKVVLQGD